MTETINDLYLYLRKQLKEAEIASFALEARELCAFACDVNKNQTANWGFLYISDTSRERAQQLLERRLAGEPLAYILGEWDFYSLTFKVTSDVLIPRSDTESLCDYAIDSIKDTVNPRVLDICCGSGCIGIAIAKNVKDSSVTAVDISEKALEIAKENAVLNEVEQSYNAVTGDALSEPDDTLGKFHLIVSNPPYITSSEMIELDDGVREYEPTLALFGGDDGLDFYRNIAKKWKGMLLDGGKIMFECGYLQGQQVADILKECDFDNIKILEDLSGVPRFVIAGHYENYEQMLQF